jgi:peptidoglycan/LPS O-acetylase OafA/YrhL
VIAVILYHAAFGFIKGGFLGVEVFFVISGYLITSLLLLERERTGSNDLKEFWIRRARRLLPGLVTLLALVMSAALLFAQDAINRLAQDTLAALTYSINWVMIFRQDSYFEAFARPPLLLHLWSLAIEEQFYVIWPLTFAGGMALLARRSKPRFGTVNPILPAVLFGIAVSTALMWVLYTPFEDPSRIYFGTDTRAAGILVGVALGLFWKPWQLHRRLGSLAVFGLNLAGALALVGLTRILLRIGEYDPALYQGGFLAVSLLTAMVIAVIVHPQGKLNKVLGVGLLVWIGKRSYGLYLFHWPVFMLLRPGVEVPWGRWPTLALQLTLTIAIAEASYRWIEQPIRRHGLRAWVSGIMSVPRPVWAAAAATALFAAIMVGVIDISAVDPSPASISLLPSPKDPNAGSPAPASSPASTTLEGPLLLIGDSVMRGAIPDLAAALGSEVPIDAETSREMQDVPGVIDEHGGSQPVAGVVVIHLGTNGVFGAAHFDEVMTTLGQADAVYFVNNRVPRRWQEPVNLAIAAGVDRWERAHIIDWFDASADHREYFTDGVHLTESGREAYIALIAEAVAAP